MSGESRGGGAAATAEDPAECVTDKGYHSRSVLKALDEKQDVINKGLAA